MHAARLSACTPVLVGALLGIVACGDSPSSSPAAATQTVAATSETPAPSALPTPHYGDGILRLDRVPGEKGYWGRPSATSLVELGVDVAFDERGRLENLDDADRIAPFRPWALALYRYRQQNGLVDDPSEFCISPGGPRHFHYPGGFRIIQDRNYERVYVLFGGANRGWRVIFLDGREAPNPDEVAGTYYGHSSGRWEEDTLVVVSSGFNTRFWFSNGGLPHTEALRLTERFSRPDRETLRYEVTVDDPYTYTRPWTAEWTLDWIEGGEIAEQFCEE